MRRRVHASCSLPRPRAGGTGERSRHRPRSIGAAAHLGCACGDTRGVVNRPAIPKSGRQTIGRAPSDSWRCAPSRLALRPPAATPALGEWIALNERPRLRPARHPHRPSNSLGTFISTPTWNCRELGTRTLGLSRSGCSRSEALSVHSCSIATQTPYLYRAIDSTGATIDFVLSGLRYAVAAKRLFRKALTDLSHPQPRAINIEQHLGAGPSSDQTMSESQAGVS